MGKTRRKRVQIRATGEDGRSEDFTWNTLGLGLCLNQHWTTSMRANPWGCLDDGIAELNAVSGDATSDEVLSGFLMIDSGAHAVGGRMKSWLSKRVRDVNFKLKGPGVVNIDGEIF